MLTVFTRVFSIRPQQLTVNNYGNANHSSINCCNRKTFRAFPVNNPSRDVYIAELSFLDDHTVPDELPGGLEVTVT